VFGTREAARFLLKWNALSTLAVFPESGGQLPTEYSVLNSNTFQGELGAELKISPLLSLHAASLASYIEGTPYNNARVKLDWRVEPRFYFDMPARIRQGTSANNFSGNYIGIEYQNVIQWGSRSGNKLYESMGGSLRFGMQRRLFRYGYADISGGIGYRDFTYRYPDLTYRDKIVFLNTRVAIGLAFGAPRPKQEPSAPFCDVLRCFEEDRQMFRIDLLRAFQFNTNRIQFKPSLAFERKAGNSPFSAEFGLYTLLESQRWLSGPDGQKSWSSHYGLWLSAEPRWYFLQKRRIATGKSGNNLSGVFIGLHTRHGWIFDYASILVDGQLKSYTIRDSAFSPLAGVQYRIFRHGFIQYKTGPYWNNNSQQNNSFDWLSEIKVGLAF
jgi:hypothetical protein